MKLLCKAESVIERDALIEYLKTKDIETVSPPRDISRKISANSLDLSYAGYSAIFDGFSVYVHEHSFDEAIAELQQFKKEYSRPVLKEADPVDYKPWNRFHSAAAWSLLFPVLMHFAALLAFNDAIKKQKFELNYRMLFSFIFLILAAVMGYFLLFRLSNNIFSFLSEYSQKLNP